MSDKQKTYVNPIFIKSRNTSIGEILKLSILADDLIEFLNEHKDNGWVNIDILQRREPSEKGHTHYAVLDDWKPSRDQNNNTADRNISQKQTPIQEDAAEVGDGEYSDLF